MQLWRIKELVAYRTHLEKENSKELELNEQGQDTVETTLEEKLLLQYLEEVEGSKKGTKRKHSAGGGIRSKWERLDDEEEDGKISGGKAVEDLFDDTPSDTNTKQRGRDTAKLSSQSEGAAGAEVVDEAKRRKYREVRK